MKRMNRGLVIAALSIALLGTAGCASLQPPPPAPAPAPEEIHAEITMVGIVISIYHPDTRTLYLWSGDPRPTAKRPMSCIETHISSDPAGTPKSENCPKA